MRGGGSRLLQHEPGAFSSSPNRLRSGSLSTFRCGDERCIHYIYGLPSQFDRDYHARTHSGQYSKRDSGLSVTTPPLTASKPLHAIPSSAETVRPVHQPRIPRPGSASHQPALSLQTQPRERRGSSVGFSVPNSRPVTRGGSSDSEYEPVLPPLKRSRVGHSRLQSIGELQLLRDNDPCLRCKVSHKAVSATLHLMHVSLIIASVTPTSLARIAPSILQPEQKSIGGLWAVTEAPSPPLLMSSCHPPSHQGKPALRSHRPWPTVETQMTICSELMPSLRIL